MAEQTELVGRVREAARAGDVAELAAVLVRAAAADGEGWGGDADEVLRAVREMPEPARVSLGHELTDRYHRTDPYDPSRPACLALLDVLARDLPGDVVTGARARRLEAYGRQGEPRDDDAFYDLARSEVEAGRALPGPAVAALRRVLHSAYGVYGRRQEFERFVQALSGPPLSPGEQWADRALADADERGEAWRLLLRHLAGAGAAQPTKAWDREALRLVEEAGGGEAVGERALAWLSLAGRPRSFPLERGWDGDPVNEVYDPHNATALRGLAWLASLLPPREDTARQLGELVTTSLRKVPGVGPRSPKVANAGVFALSRLPGEAALAELARLSVTVTYKVTARRIDAALRRRAEDLGLSREEVEELAVPSYGLTEAGHGERTLGECTAVLEVTGGGVTLSWRNEKGRAVKSPPAAVRAAHPEEVKALKATVKDAERMLAARRDRLDRQFLSRRVWAYPAWRERLLDHPLTGTLARRLLWTVDGVAVGWHDGSPRTLDGREVTGGERVELWHPAGREMREVLAWRERLEERGVTQPFKQAHREVYPLTDAERATGVYSNRFAGHVLRQHQFHALAAARGWTSRLRLSVDDSYPPAERELPEWGLRAEYWVEGAGTDYEGALLGSGAYAHLATDQVRFYPIDAPRNRAHAGGGDYRPERSAAGRAAGPLPLTEVPPLVLSEVLRDVDLFVGVAGVGNDPTWQDGGPEGRFRRYWDAYGFGELQESARVRREVLTRLVPRLAIADRCALEERFLEVRGDLHRYRIHLGSGNVLIEPEGRYLCIVPAAPRTADAEATVRLPFEGDARLSLILSKALLLARDTEITDPTILSQL